MKRLLGIVCLVLAGSVALAGDDEKIAQIEHDIASVDTDVRTNALHLAAHLKDRDARRRILIVLTRDPHCGIRCQTFECSVLWAHGPEATAAVVSGLDDADWAVRCAAIRAAETLSAEDTLRLPADRALWLISVGNKKHLLGAIEWQISEGVAVSVSAILAQALDTQDPEVQAGLVRCALHATTVAPLDSSTIPVLRKLLARKDTREKTIGLLARARGPVGWSLLLEVEATTTDASERERAQNAIEHHEGHAKEFHSVLEEVAKNSTDERVRALARRRLEDW